MTWQDYQRIEEGRLASIGMLDGEYVMERKIQSGMASDFYKITKEEYDSYDSWCMNEDKIMDIRLRKAWCRGFFRSSEFKMFI